MADLRVAPRLLYLHTPQRLRQHDWYAVPLRQLLQEGCSHFFWTDHDELYLHEHVAAGLAELAQADFSVSRRTCVYHAHQGSVSARGWLDSAFG